MLCVNAFATSGEKDPPYGTRCAWAASTSPAIEAEWAPEYNEGAPPNGWDASYVSLPES